MNFDRCRSRDDASKRGEWLRCARVLGLGLLSCLSLWVGQPNLAVAQAGVTARGLPDFTDLVDQVGPSVVNIRTSQRVKNAAGNPDIDPQMQEFFRRFFGVPLPNMPSPSPKEGDDGDNPETQPRGVGSGFIFSPDGYVLTNAHVVDGADEVVVTLTDKREFKAKIIGVDKRTDVALVKIEATGLPAVKIGDVNRLKVGEWVLAIGSPFGLDNTVTSGIVSAKARDTGEYVPFIQTDVAINPGNSGGPLINMRGEVVGINSQILSRSGGFMGISFSIPIDEATRVADQLRANGRVVRGRIGVQIDQVTKDVADSLGMSKASGALVRSVEAGGPADKAGVQAGDIITRFDGKVIDKAADLARFVGNTKPGTRSSVQVWRRGSTKDLAVVVALMPSEGTATAQTPPVDKRVTPAADAWGLSLGDIDAAQKRQLKVSGGARVLEASGAAARAGLRAGDVIVAIANTEITDAQQCESVLARLDKSKSHSVLFRRGDWAQYTLLRAGR